MHTLHDELHEGEPPPLPTEPRYYHVHPLFPLPEGVRETKEICEITFDRWDHQGKKERCPDRFPASELRSLAQVVDMFGGGTYQFIAFDSHGHFSKWTSEKDKVRFAVPCKAFRHAEHESPTEAPAPRAAAAAPSPSNDLVPLLIAAQERADRMLAAMLERNASPALDPMAMLTGLATVLEKLRPPPAPPQPSGGDMIGQLSGLVGIAKQIVGKAQPAAAEEDAALQPLLTMMTNAMAQKAAAPAPEPPAPPPQRSDLIWVDVPQIGPVMMRPEQAAAVCARLANPSAPPSAAAAPAQPPPAPSSPPQPSAPAPAAQAFANSWDDVAARLKNPAEQLAFKQAIERIVAPSADSPSTAPPAAPSPPIASRSPAPAPVAPPASTPAPAPAPAAPPTAVRTPTAEAQVPQTAAPAPAPPAPAPAQPSTEPKCIVCGIPGSPDPAQPNVLVCHNNHRSLLAMPQAEEEDTDALVPLDAIPTEHIEAILADEETLRAMPAQMVASFRREADARKTKSRPPGRGS